MSFSNLKKSSKSATEDLSKKLLEQNSGGFQKDPRFWTLETDKSGNAFAVIRFLPACNGESIPWARIYSHSFKVNGKWYIENCPTTLGNGTPCPCCEQNSVLWNSGIESDKKIAGDRKRKLRYNSNIMVIKDPSNPSNNGKVFLYNYGTKIFAKIEALMSPTTGEESCNPFDFWAGRDFKIRVKTVADYPNYDDSSFEGTSALLGGDDAALEALWKTEYPLLPFVAPDQFKSYDVLKEKFNKIVLSSVQISNHSQPNTAPTQSNKPMPNVTQSAPFDADEDNTQLLKNLLNDSQ